MKITIFGLPGVGTSTAAQKLSSVLGYDFISTGGMFREKAKKMGITLNELDKLSQTDKSHDLEMDQEIAEFGRQNDNFIIDSRLAWYFVPDSLKVKLTCPDQERFDRIAKREGITREEAEKMTKEREGYKADRYFRYYGLSDYASDHNFDLIIDSLKNDPDQVVAAVLEVVRSTGDLSEENF